MINLNIQMTVMHVFTLMFDLQVLLLLRVCKKKYIVMAIIIYTDCAT